MPRLEICGAVIVAKPLSHMAKIINILTYAWSDSVIVLSWLRGNLRRFKPFVGNRVLEILDLTPPTC